jgi:transposase
LTVNKEFYLEVLRCLQELIRKKRPESWKAKQWILHHDNALAHSLLVQDFLTKMDTTVIPQPPYSPHLASADFFLFPKLKSTLKGGRFDTIEEIKENLLRDLKAIPKQVFQDCFQNWKKRWKQCISSEDDKCN